MFPNSVLQLAAGSFVLTPRLRFSFFASISMYLGRNFSPGFELNVYLCAQSQCAYFIYLRYGNAVSDTSSTPLLQCMLSASKYSLYA